MNLFKLVQHRPFSTGSFNFTIPKIRYTDVYIQRKFLEDIAKKLELKGYEDWYSLTAADLEEYGGRNVLKYYADSLPKALTNVFPDYNWRVWKFSQVPKGFWKGTYDSFSDY